MATVGNACEPFVFVACRIARPDRGPPGESPQQYFARMRDDPDWGWVLVTWN